MGDSRTWYRKEIRIIKNDKSIRSYKDAQGFRKAGQKLQVKPINAQIYHYGWVRDPRFQQAKQESFNKLWHSDDYVQQNVANANEYDYKTIDSLKRFEGTQPAIMQERLDHMNWVFTWDINQKKFSLKEGFLYWFEKLTSKRLFEYKNYKEI